MDNDGRAVGIEDVGKDLRGITLQIDLSAGRAIGTNDEIGKIAQVFAAVGVPTVHDDIARRELYASQEVVPLA